ncbi:MAG: glycosyltransferase family 2 protein [Actinomycetota bacterium]
MPVYNGERYIEQALNSLLSQSFEDFELVILDNGSMDGTEGICRAYAAKDERVKYFRNRQNYGIVYNFNTVFRLTTGHYFKWAAADDICEPDYLLRAVEMLDRDPSVVLVWAKTSGIDENGEPAETPSEVSDLNSPESVYSPDPTVRFRRLLRNIWWVDGPFYGLMRGDVLARTPLHPKHMSGDQILIAELSLHGRFYEIPQNLFFTRVHSGKASRVSTLGERAALIDSGPHTRRGPKWWRLVRGYPERLYFYLAAIRRAPITGRERMICRYEVGRTVMWWVRLRGSQRAAAGWRRLAGGAGRQRR